MRTAMLTVFAVACTVAALALAPCAHAHGGAPTATHPAGRVALDPTTRQFVLPDGRHFLMHGLAVDNNAGLPEVTDDTMQTMAAWGFNAVRLGFHWSLYEPVQGEPNSTYLSGIAQVVKRLGEYGIFVVLDMHQDVWAPMYCNAHGFPDWIGSPTNSSEYYKGGSKAFPEPMAKPSYTNDTSQAPWGTVDAATCQAASQAGFGWASSYLTYALGNAVQRLYDNEDGILDLYGRFWATVAREVCMPNANCLGYELLNEPWVGDVFKNPLLIYGPEADKTNLQKFYASLHASIRKVDNTSIIFFEPATGGNEVGAFPTGLTEGPGGAAYNDRQALTYHIYCPWLETDMPYKNKSLEQFDQDLCDVLNELEYDIRISDTKRLGVGGFLTEFGAEVQDKFGLEYLHHSMRKLDEAIHSWTYWYLTPDAAKPNFEARALTRTYPHAVGGSLINLSFNETTAAFSMQLSPAGVTPAAAAMQTEVFASSEFHYPSGLEWSVTPVGAMKGAYNASSGLLTLTPTYGVGRGTQDAPGGATDVFPAVVTVAITPK